MTREYSIASVTVAHNSAQLLPKQLDALLRQSWPLEEIIVVDNSSTDETRDLLSAKYPQVTVLNLPANLGVGGGFAAGLAYAATEKEHDWVWLLDDDSVPRDNGLEMLLKGLAQVEGSAASTAILAPLPIHSGTQVSYPGLLWQSGWVVPSPEVLNQPVWLVDWVISSGSLVRCEAVNKVGFPRADFFMDFVDVEYCLRLRRHGYKIAVVRESLLDHAIGNPRTVKILGYSRIWADQPPWREYYLWRNYVFTIWTNYADWKSRFFVLRRMLRHATGILAFGEQKGVCLRMMLLGFLDGRAGRLGIRFLPCLRSASSL